MNSPTIPPNALITAAVAVFVCWRIYARYRRLIGRQVVRSRRLTASMVLFPLLIALIALSAWRSATMIEALVAGVGGGVALGLVGLKLTRFEVTDAGFYYTPNTALGVAVMLLFIGRLAYRFGAIFLAGGRIDPTTMQSLGSSPLTLAIFGVVAAYYTTSASGILLWYRGARGQAGQRSAIAGTSTG
jgi:hypothetical protein